MDDDDNVFTTHQRQQTPRRSRRFDSCFTVWYKEDMAVFGWVKHVLGVKIDNYKIFEDGILMCAIANNLWEGCISREEVLYGSALQRLELSVKAMHTYLGVMPVLDACAVVEGCGQEDLLSYLLSLKQKSDELEKHKADIRREELWTKLMEGGRHVTPATNPSSDTGNKSLTIQERRQGLQSEMPTPMAKSPPTNTGLPPKGTMTPTDMETYSGTYDKKKDHVSFETAQVDEGECVTEPLKRQETYVVETSPAQSSRNPPPDTLKRSSLTVTLSTPPQTPLDVRVAEFDYNQPSSETKDHDSEMELVTNLNDLLDDPAPNSRKFPRSGFDRNVMYSPFSMPFISVREKKGFPNHHQVSVNQKNRPDDIDSRPMPVSLRTSGNQGNISEMSVTMMARMSARAPKGTMTNVESDE